MAQHALDIREALLKSGKEEFLAHGFEKASLRVICKKAGLTTGAFYAGAFGAIYIVLMLIVVLAASRGASGGAHHSGGAVQIDEAVPPLLPRLQPQYGLP